MEPKRDWSISATSSAARLRARPSSSRPAHRVEIDSQPICRCCTLDPVLFEQVLFNLLDNAAKYAPAGTHDRAACRGATAPMVTSCRSLDEGDGIPPADLERIFDKFYRVRAGDQQRAGTGLGLPSAAASSKRWAARSSPATARDRGGAVFTIRLAGARTVAARGACGMSQATLPLRVLVVDDEPPIRRFLRTSLAAQGYRGRSRPRTAEARWDALRASRSMSSCSISACRTWTGSNHPPHARVRLRIPIIVLSSRANEADKVKALDLGADDYVTKPFGMDELLARVRAALRHRLQQQGERPVFKSGDLRSIWCAASSRCAARR